MKFSYKSWNGLLTFIPMRGGGLLLKIRGIMKTADVDVMGFQ
jgi:hypothetical protein